MTVTTKDFLKESEGLGNNGVDIKIEFEAPTYDVSQKKLYFKGFADSSKPNSKYEVKVAFFDVVMSYQDFKDNKWGLTSKDLLDKPVKVDCKCKSYVFGGALKGNLHSGCALYTNTELTNYVKKTDREEKNPENKPRGCKHIIAAIKQILETLD